MIGAKRFLIGALLGKPTNRYHNGVVIGDCPETIIKKPMGILAESKTVAGIVITRIGELVNVCCIHDAASRDRREAKSSQRTSVVIRGDDI